MVGGTLATILPGFSTDSPLLVVSGVLSAAAVSGQQLVVRATAGSDIIGETTLTLEAGATAWQAQLPPLVDGTYDIVALVREGNVLSSPSSAYRQKISGGAYDIDLVIDTTPLIEFGLSSTQIDAVLLALDGAADRVSDIITGDLAALVLTETSSGTPRPVLIDDLVIRVDFFRGTQLGVLASAGPELIRSSNKLPVFGVMEFDLTDIDFMLQNNLLQPVVIHEMAHVLGLGTLWELFGLNTQDGVPNGTAVGRYIGPNALREYNTLLDAAGPGATDATFVPLANEPGFAHWDEDLFGNELMTPFVAPGALPFSALSIGALADLGYTVNYAAADAYSLIGVPA